MNHCGTRMPFHIDLEGQEMPENHLDTITAKLCSTFVVLGKEACCIFHSDITIFKCNNYTLYNHAVQPDVLGRSCMQGKQPIVKANHCIMTSSNIIELHWTYAVNMSYYNIV